MARFNLFVSAAGTGSAARRREAQNSAASAAAGLEAVREASQGQAVSVRAEKPSPWTGLARNMDKLLSVAIMNRQKSGHPVLLPQMLGHAAHDLMVVQFGAAERLCADRLPPP
jgi:hypothetical protein